MIENRNSRPPGWTYRVAVTVPLLWLLMAACGPSDGPYIDHYPNGNVKERGEYRDGEKTGRWVFYWEDGTRKTAGFYTKGEPSGTWTYYDKGGRVIGEGTYKHGKMWDGTFVRYVFGTMKIMRIEEGEEKTSE